MTELRIEYVHESLRCRLRIEGDRAGFWSAISSLLYNETEDFESSFTEITVPWWVFLLKRRQIGELAKIRRVRVSFDEGAKENLVIANARVQSFTDARVAEMPSVGEVESLLERAEFSRTLFPYQMENVRRLVSLPSGASFSVPGAGKTTEALAFYATRRDRDTKLLIVCPKNAFAVWEEEFGNCFEEGEDVRIARLRALSRHEDSSMRVPRYC